MAIFTIALIIFFSLSTDDSTERKVGDLNTEVQKLVTSVSGQKNSTPPSQIISGTRVNTKVLDTLANLSYSELKNALGVSADFCIHFEDKEGNIINVTGPKTGIGSGLIQIAGVRCNKTLE